MQACRECGSEVDRTFRFCPWCATPQRRKLVEFFPAHASIESDRGKALRVSRYLNELSHVRFSVWDESGRAQAAVSLSEQEAGRLAAFISEQSEPRRRRRLCSPPKRRSIFGG